MESPPDGMPEVEFHMPVRTAALSMVLNVAFVAGFTYMTVAGHGPFVATAAICALFFAYMAVRFGIRLFSGRPWMLLMDDGMTFAFVRTVTWEEVKSVAVVSGLSRDAWKGFINVELHDPAAYLERLSWAQRRNARLGMQKGYGPIRLPGEAFQVPLADVVIAMRQFDPDLVVGL